MLLENGIAFFSRDYGASFFPFDFSVRMNTWTGEVPFEAQTATFAG